MILKIPLGTLTIEGMSGTERPVRDHGVFPVRNDGVLDLDGGNGSICSSIPPPPLCSIHLSTYPSIHTSIHPPTMHIPIHPFINQTFIKCLWRVRHNSGMTRIF